MGLECDFLELKPSERYAWMIRTITPRPIAWVSTLSPRGVPNLAPFSYFAGVGSDPPSLMISIANRADGSPKDTLRNLREVPEFVVNVVPYDLREPMWQTSADLPYESSEFLAANLTPTASRCVRPPRVQEAPVQLECRVHQIVAIGSSHAVFGIIHWLHVDERVLDEHGKLSASRLDSIGRLGGRSYSRTTERFDMQ